MNDDQLQPQPAERPVLTGLVALVGVAVVVGLVVGVVAMVGTRALGIGDDAPASGGATNRATLHLPDPTDTFAGTEPYITLSEVPEPRRPREAPATERTEEPEDEITLQAGQSAVAPMERIDLTGVYPTGEGSVLTVQQFKDGAWADFPVTASVSGGSFTTYIQAGQLGLNRFRMYDPERDVSSNEVEIRIG